MNNNDLLGFCQDWCVQKFNLMIIDQYMYTIKTLNAI